MPDIADVIMDDIRAFVSGAGVAVLAVLCKDALFRASEKLIPLSEALLLPLFP
jgi:hypothetical protein